MNTAEPIPEKDQTTPPWWNNASTDEELEIQRKYNQAMIDERDARQRLRAAAWKLKQLRKGREP